MQLTNESHTKQIFIINAFAYELSWPPRWTITLQDTPKCSKL